MKEKTEGPKTHHQVLWQPATTGTMKLNFDGGKGGDKTWACFKGLQVAYGHGYHSLVVEEHCLPLIQKLQHSITDDNVLGCIVSDIIELAKAFSFISFSFVKRDSRVA